MPTYDYQCRSCGFISEVVHSMLEDGPTACHRCGGQLRRVVHPTGIIFRGSGFYKTDSRSSSSGSGASGSRPASTTAGDAGAASTPAEGGSASKPSTPAASGDRPQGAGGGGRHAGPGGD